MLSPLYTNEEADPEQYRLLRRMSPPVNHMRQLLIRSVDLISHSDYSAAGRIISLLSACTSPYGDSTERLVHQFANALSVRLNQQAFKRFLSSSSSFNAAAMADPNSLKSCYLTLNQVTPFIRFCHLTANQAILEAIEERRLVHILDMDTMHGVQWPPLIQAIAERAEHSTPPPAIRITGVGCELETLRRTGDRLQKFAESLGISFHFHPLHVNGDNAALHLSSALTVLPDEVFAVNCVLYLQKLLKDGPRDLRFFLRAIRAMSPRIVTVAERECSHNHPTFPHRFMETLDHYAAIFDSLEATLPPNNPERLAVEQIWFGKEIADVVAADRDDKREKHQKFVSWVEMMQSCGFSNVPLSPYAHSQAKLLLRLHYPSEGYQLEPRDDSLFLGWRDRTLFSVASWR